MTQSTSSSSLTDFGEFEENNSARIIRARITTKDDEDSTLAGVSSPEEYFYDSLEEANNSRLSNSTIGSEAPVGKLSPTFAIPGERPRAVAWTISLTPTGRDDGQYCLSEIPLHKENLEDGNNSRQSNTATIGFETLWKTDRAASGISDELPRVFPGTLHPAVITQDKGDYSLDLTPTPRENTYHLFQEGKKFGQLDTDKLRRCETPEETERPASGISDELPRVISVTEHPAVTILDTESYSRNQPPSPKENHSLEEGNYFDQLDTGSETPVETSNPVPGTPDKFHRATSDTFVPEFPTELHGSLPETLLPPVAFRDSDENHLDEASFPGIPAELQGALPETLIPPVEFRDYDDNHLDEASFPGIPAELHGVLPDTLLPEFHIELPRAISEASLPGKTAELHGPLPETLLPPVAFRDYDDNHLDETASPKTNTSYFFDDEQNSKQLNTAGSESPVDPAPRRPAELRAATSWIIPFGVTTRNNDKATVYGTSSLSQTFHDSLDDEISSGRANKNIKLRSEAPLKKKQRVSRIPRRLPRGSPGTLLPKLTARTSGKPTRIPKPTLEHYPRLNKKKTRTTKIPILRDLRLARKNIPSTKRDLPHIKRAKVSRIPVRVSRPTSKPSPSNKDGMAQDFQKSKQPRNTIRSGNNCRRSEKILKQKPTARKSNAPKKPTQPQGKNTQNFEKALKRSHTAEKNGQLIIQKKRSSRPVSVNKKHPRQKEETLTLRNDKVPNEDPVTRGICPDTYKAMDTTGDWVGSKEVQTANEEPEQECGGLDNSAQEPNASLSPVLKIKNAQDEGKLSPNTVTMSLLQGMKSIAKEVEEIKNRIGTFDKITNAERAEETSQQVPSKHTAKSTHSVFAETVTTSGALDVENMEKNDQSPSPETNNKMIDDVERGSYDYRKSSCKTKTTASEDGNKKSKQKTVRVKCEADHLIEQTFTTETNHTSNEEHARTPSIAKKSTPDETVWERLAKKPTRSTRNGNNQPDTSKINSEAKTGSKTKRNDKKTPKSETTNVRRRPKSPDCTMLANATDIFASGLRFHKSESPKDKDKRSKTNFDLAKDKYLRLLEQADENDTLIEDNKKKIEQQESELDNAYEEAHRYIVDIAQSTSGVVEARKIHCNFKDEAARLRVLHKTNLIAADIYEADTTILQGRITELQQEIKETKAINHLDPCELKEKIQDILACRSDQRDTNRQIETQIKRLRDRLNVLKCGDMLQDDEPDTCTSEDKQIDVERGTYERIYVKAETMEGVMVNTHDETEVVIGSSRSADAVSENKVKPPRETKSDQDQSPREDESVLVHKRALLHRRKSSAERLRNVMKSTDQVECPLGEGDQISPRQLPPLLLPSKQSPDEPMPTYGVRHPTWPRPSYLSGQLPGFHVPLPPLHPRIDDGFPKTTNPLPHQPMFPRPFEREIPTPAIRTPLPSICSGQSDGDNTMPDHSPHPPLSPNLPPINRPKTGIRRKPV